MANGSARRSLRSATHARPEGLAGDKDRHVARKLAMAEGRAATMEIGQLRSGWKFIGMFIRPERTRIPPSRQDGFRWGEAPDTMCLANFQLSRWDDGSRREQAFHSEFKIPKAEFEMARPQAVARRNGGRRQRRARARGRGFSTVGATSL